MKANILWHTQRAYSIMSQLNVSGFVFRIYQGTIPNAAAIASGFVAANYSANLLLTYAALGANSFARTNDNYQRTFLSVLPADVAASASGTATWFSLTGSNTAYTIIGDVSLVNDNAPLKLIDTNIVSGTTYGIYSFAFTFKQ